MCRVTIDTAEARKSLRFTEVRDGKDRRIVVDAVAVGSEAEAVRPRRQPQCAPSMHAVLMVTLVLLSMRVADLVASGVSVCRRA